MQPKESKSKKHFIISLIKSAVRIASAIDLSLGNLWYAGVLLLIAEVLGIIEEF